MSTVNKAGNRSKISENTHSRLIRLSDVREPKMFLRQATPESFIALPLYSSSRWDEQVSQSGWQVRQSKWMTSGRQCTENVRLSWSWLLANKKANTCNSYASHLISRLMRHVNVESGLHNATAPSAPIVFELQRQQSICLHMGFFNKNQKVKRILWL